MEGHGGPAGDLTENGVAHEIVDAAYRVHRELGPGLLESVYEKALAYELEERGITALRQVGVPVFYRGVEIGTGFVADLVVEGLVIVEIKSVDTVLPVHKRQLLTYLKLGQKRLGLLINFNELLIKDGITRVVCGLET